MILVPKPGILDIETYSAGHSDAPGVERVIKLSSNESPIGPSPKAIAAAQEAITETGIYAEAGARDLRKSLAEFYGLDAARIVCGNGSNELLTIIANCYLQPKDEAVMSAHGFLLYKIATLANSAVPIPTVPPSNQPSTRTEISMPNLATAMLTSSRARPVMSPSRGPGPRPAPM